ncbi:hypothetical protein CCR75_004584 [Bremia lactucae]|uniref:RNB domain-containing protein n=1 Tax=Bremia lactucae TaxID=4779 RepID=A0A976IF10_BRELC|nr:hypothetical protein CCR75_004584 [Bremia lactucae]
MARVKTSWHEALGDEAISSTQSEAHRPKSRIANLVLQPEFQGAKAKSRRTKRHPNDVRTEQDMDATAGFDETSESEYNEVVDTFGGAGFVLVDLERELDIVATAKCCASALCKSKSKRKKASKKAGIETKKQQEVESMKRPHEETKKEKKLRQGEKLLESLEAQDGRVEKTDKVKKTNAVTEKVSIVSRANGHVEEGEHGKEPVEAMNGTKKKEIKLQKEALKTKKMQNVIQAPSSSNETDKIKKALASRSLNRNDQMTQFSKYLDRDVVVRGLEKGKLVQGKLRVNANYCMDGYITVDGLSMDVLIKGMQNRNRALDNDVVAVRLHPESQWKPLNDDGNVKAIKTSVVQSISSNTTDNENALHSLWLPSVDTDENFFKHLDKSNDSADLLRQSMKHLNERISRSGRRPTGTVVFVLAQGNSNGFVGSLEAATKVKDMKTPLSINDNFAYFHADDQRLPRRIRIPKLQLPDEFIRHPLLYSKTMLCFCRIKTWPTKSQSPTGEFIKTLGEYTGIETGISAIILKHGLQAHTLDFDSTILNELDEKYGLSGEKWEIPDVEVQTRRDFRATQIFSIDPSNARDLDDALHIRAVDEARTKFEIGVHIADVTYFIEPNSRLDHEARSRATSVYLPNRVLPMLPRLLCEKLCSLQPQVDRLAFSVVWQMHVDGTLVDGVEPWFGKSIIRSCCKLDYSSAQKMLDGVIHCDNVDAWVMDRRPIPDANPHITNASVIQSVKDLWSIGANRRAMRFETGAISLDNMKLVFSLNSMGNPTRYGSYEQKDSNRLVEEYMLLANYLVAQQTLRFHGPLAFLRHHPPPVTRAMDQAIKQLDKSGIQLDGQSTRQLAKSLERVRNDEGETTFVIVQALITKPMKPAEYIVAGNEASVDSWRHYALNIPYYTHFTSPIRRYADVVVHRLLEKSLTNISIQTKDFESKRLELTSVAQNCNEKNLASKCAEIECDQVFLCSYAQHCGDIEATGVVLSVGQKSFTVFILELGLEKRLILQELCLKGTWNGKTSELSIELPEIITNRELRMEDTDNCKKGVSKMVLIVKFMKHLRMRVSTTKKMPPNLAFSIIGEKN